MAESVRRVRPAPSNAYLANPHKGCCTFQHFNGDELFTGIRWSEEGPLEFPPAKYDFHAPGYLPSTVAYCRWFWEIFEPEEGKFDFTPIERSIETARSRGQTLAIRIMPFGSPGQPLVPKWYRDKYPMEIAHDFGDNYQPVHDSPEYLEKFGRVIRECGRRYDGHPDIETMDVGYIGPWGEGAGEMSVAQMHRFNQIHREAFPTTIRLVEICGTQGKVGMEYAAGWRWNTFGDLSDFGSPEVTTTCSWNHTFDAYPEALVNNAGENWKKFPVHCETCGVPMEWYLREWDIDLVLQQGFKYHTTYFMPKSCPLPPAWLEKLNAFCRMIGYRFIYRQALYETPVRAGGSFQFKSWIENVGCAPIYRKYDFALRLRQGDREEIVVLPEVDIRKWLPGDALIDTRVQLPAGIKPGFVHLAAGLVDPKTKQARVRFASKEVFSDRWLALAGIEVQ